MNKVNDPFGFLPKFALQGKPQEYKSLIDAAQDAETLTLDFDALNTFFRVGMYLEGGTPFTEIRRVLPAPIIVEPRTIDRMAALDGYLDLFRAAVRKNFTPQFAVAISGGADSRHILLELISQEKRPAYTLTVAIPGRASEVEIARLICTRAEVPQRIVWPDPKMSVDNEMWKNLACDFMCLEHGWFAEVGRNRDELPWWDGIGGDVLSAGLFLNPENLKSFEENRLDELAESIVPNRGIPLIRDQSLFPREDAVNALYRELVKHRDAPNPVGSFYFWNRTRISIGSCAFGLLRSRGQQVIAPYLDVDLVRFLSSPATMLIDHEFHRDAIRRGYPEFSDIGYFENREAIPRIHRQKQSLALLKLLMKQELTNVEILGTSLRTLRAMIFRSRACDIDWLLPHATYWAQVRKLIEMSHL
ncbi:MAG: hypothetical protein KIT83_03610 [Bryobacterales bacterium]|nr:hypothetical protein [Bryobacterales bacterium]